MSLGAALLAGLIAILLNTALLHLADLIPLKVQGGGLFRLLQFVFGSLVEKTSMPTLCCHSSAMGLPEYTRPLRRVSPITLWHTPRFSY